MVSWKIIAVVFIILFIIETILFTGLIYIGSKEISKENECAINICSEADSFQYEQTTNMCYCYKDNEIILERYIK